MASTSLSPSLLAKLKIRDTINKMRHKSPQLQEVLRQRCREKMTERRKNIYNRRRLGLEFASKEVENAVTDVMCEEIDNLTKSNWAEPFEELSNIPNETLDQEETLRLETELGAEEDQWILAEYELMLQREIEWLESLAREDAKEVVCPVCQKCILHKIFDTINCQACGLQLSNHNDLQAFGNLIETSVNDHSVNCKAVPGFTVLRENTSVSLYMTCEECSSLTCVV